MHDPITGKNIILLSIAYFTICCNLNPSKKGIGEKNYYVNEIMWESSWYVSSNWCGGSAMYFYWNIWKSRSDNNDRNFSLVMGYFEMIYREISHEWLDQFLPQELILRGATNFYALESRRSLVPVYFKNCFGANFEYLLNSRYQSAKPTDLKIMFLAF